MNKTMTRIADAVRTRTKMTTQLYSVVPSQGGSRVEVCYRGTLVALIDGFRIELDAHGWRSVTTKNVMNAALIGAEVDAHLSQKGWTWYLSSPNEPPRQFMDGMEVAR